MGFLQDDIRYSLCAVPARALSGLSKGSCRALSRVSRWGLDLSYLKFMLKQGLLEFLGISESRTHCSVLKSSGMFLCTLAYKQ